MLRIGDEVDDGAGVAEERGPRRGDDPQTASSVLDDREGDLVGLGSRQQRRDGRLRDVGRRDGGREGASHRGDQLGAADQSRVVVTHRTSSLAGPSCRLDEPRDNPGSTRSRLPSATNGHSAVQPFSIGGMT